ncbi:hypothetical protein [Corynebacterium phoceense]|uniref:hypothetical protein n=1 Tax=Corynebacterium phoceense TaxID=1686286 RepID=UPI00211C4C3F|nr:hypothetical protein [Corynebacterium phoceense]MCQ9331749.1 hypothetical protein [Corynebacterium phoceense]
MHSPSLIVLATFAAPLSDAPGQAFSRCYNPAPAYPANRRAALTGQYPQREATTRITDVFAEAGWTVTEDPTAHHTGPTFLLLEEPDPAILTDLLDTNPQCVLAAVTLTGDHTTMSLDWPGVVEDGDCAELVSPLDLAPTLAAIAGLDVRPNARLSFDGLNLVPVLRYGAAGHAALFFDNGIRTIDASLIDGEAHPESLRAALQDEWDTWRGFMGFGPLQ